MDKVLTNSTHLMGSEGKEYDEEDSNLDIKERLAKQRQILNSRLGLDVANKTGIDLSEIFTNEDLVNHSAEDVKKDMTKVLLLNNELNKHKFC